ncbi:putrescine importer [Scopulibacillus darangshiensis]|uniref:Putrescine importer n=1 Tax=Scopulibacillus darangshiensis TaxID=442528 RepID=A0A4R2P8U5_9BACL|nr:APC family permease [Scopulibacillus darangshiensis]TCP30614.1 putrescine importer [Scopulibacillus darangshiensis]
MQESHGQLERSLKLRHIVFLGLAYMSPFAVFDTFGIVSDTTNGHVPASYILITVAILFTAFSYGKMVKVYPTAGSAYTYTRQTMNASLGFLVGWAALLDYLFLPMINALLTNIYLSSGFPNVPRWVWIVGLIVFITIVNIMGVKIAVSANMLMVVFQSLIALIFVILTIRAIITGDQGHFVFDPIYSHSMSIPGLFAGASILALSFLGFDAVTTLSEEAIEPKKNVPKGIFLIAIIGGVFFISVTYFMQSLFPDISKLGNIEGASPEIALFIGGKLFQSVFLAGALVSVIASGLAAQTSASRLLYAMGRDRVLPEKLFGYVHPRLKTPVFNIIFLGVLAVSALFLDLATATSFINFGAFTAFSFVNLSVIVYYFKQKRTRTFKSTIGYVIIPLIGLAFNIYLWFSLDLDALILGLIWVAIGVIYLLYLTKFFRNAPPKFDFDETING